MEQAGRRRIGWAIAVPLVFAMAGGLFVTSAELSQGTDLRSQGRTDLPDLIRAENDRVQAREDRVSDLRGQVDDLTAGAATRDTDVADLARQLEPLGDAAGLMPVAGPGLVVELDDAPVESRQIPGARPDDLVVHQADLQAVVNALWAGGAEAMMLMDQRIISTSAVRCVGNTLSLQGRVYSPPYRVQAIGDVEGMAAALEDSRGVDLFRDYADMFGLGWELRRSGELELTGYQGSLDLRFAEVPA